MFIHLLIFINLFTCLLLINCLLLWKWFCHVEDGRCLPLSDTPRSRNLGMQGCVGLVPLCQGRRLDTSVFRNRRPPGVGGTRMSSLGGQPLYWRLADFPSTHFRAGRRGSWLHPGWLCSLWAGHWGSSWTWTCYRFLAQEGYLLGKGTQQEEALGG